MCRFWALPRAGFLPPLTSLEVLSIVSSMAAIAPALLGSYLGIVRRMMVLKGQQASMKRSPSDPRTLPAEDNKLAVFYA
jgi:hypothetical protein